MKVYDVEQHRSVSLDPSTINWSKTRSIGAGFTDPKDEVLFGGHVWRGHEIRLKWGTLPRQDDTIRVSEGTWRTVLRMHWKGEV